MDNRVAKIIYSLRGHVELYYQYRSENYSKFEKDGITHISTPLSSEHQKKSLILETVKEIDYDILYTHDIHFQDGLDIISDCLRKDATLITDFHEYLPRSYPVNFRENALMADYSIQYIDEIFQKYLNFSHKVVFPSSMMRDFIFDRYSINKPNLIVENYANYYVRETKKTENRRREIVFSSRYPRSIEPFSQTIQRLKSLGFEFTVLGMDGGHELAKRIDAKYVPFLEYEELINYLSNVMFAWIAFTNAYSFEEENVRYSSPNKFADALAAGTPVIVSSNLLQLCEYINNFQVGIVLDNPDAEVSAKKIFESSRVPNYSKLLEAVQIHRNKWIFDSYKAEIIRKFVLE